MSPESIAQVHDFFAAYRDAFNAADCQSIGDCFTEPFTISSPDYLAGFASTRQVQSNIAALLEHYRKYGIANAVIESIQVQPYASGHAIAELHWRLEDTAGQEIVSFDTTYILRQQPAWKIVFVIAHNEHERFQAIAPTYS